MSAHPKPILPEWDEEKPLHVQVAEALGWQACWCSPKIDAPYLWLGFPPGRSVVSSASHCLVPLYDTDWSATGPLIEKYGIWLNPWRGVGVAGEPTSGWVAFAEDRDLDDAEDGNTPLQAVCHLILALHKSGKLNAKPDAEV